MEWVVLVVVDVDSAVRGCQSPGLSGRVRFRTVGSFRGVGVIFFLAGGLVSGASEADDIVRDGCRKLMAPWLPTAAFMLSKNPIVSIVTFWKSLNFQDLRYACVGSSFIIF